MLSGFLNILDPGQVRIPRKQSFKFFIRLCHRAESEDELKVVPRLQAVGLCALYHGVEEAGSIRSVDGLTEQPVLSFMLYRT